MSQYSAQKPKPSGAGKGWIIGLVVAGVGVAGLCMVALLAYFVAGRQAEEIQANAAERQVGPIGPEVQSQDVGTVAAQVDNLSEAECLAAARRFAEAIEAGDLEGARGLIDYDELARRSTENVKASDSFRKGFIRGFVNRAKTGAFEQQIMTAAGPGATYRILRAHRVGNETRVWIRLVSDESGLNYHDVVFYRGPDGRPRAADLYIVATGELFSQTMRRLYIMAAAGQNRSLLQRLSPDESDLVKHLDKFQALSQQVRTQPASAISIYNSLPESLRQNKVLMLLRIHAASNLDEALYAQAIDDFRHRFPQDPAVDMLSIDWHFLREEFSECLEAIESVENVVGGDPYLDTYRGNLALAQGNYPEALRFAEQSIAEDPTLPDSYWLRVSVALNQGDYDQVVEELKLLDREFAMEWEDLSQIPEYASFVNTPQHRQWLQYLQSR